ncbi:hypothetical protein F443_10971, partial [Phytophthora nicotianae P1569]
MENAWRFPSTGPTLYFLHGWEAMSTLEVTLSRGSTHLRDWDARKWCTTFSTSSDMNEARSTQRNDAQSRSD